MLIKTKENELKISNADKYQRHRVHNSRNRTAKSILGANVLNLAANKLLSPLSSTHGYKECSICTKQQGLDVYILFLHDGLVAFRFLHNDLLFFSN